jgi:DNA invertase Pin-like site-specific DNA recombinase
LTGAFAEFERSMIRERVQAGLKRARAAGKALGRRPVEDNPEGTRKANRARKLLDNGIGIGAVAKAVNLSNGIVARIKAEMAARQGVRLFFPLRFEATLSC